MSTFSILKTLALVNFIVICESTIPSGYILQVSPYCGVSDDGDAYVTVTTDLHAEAKAICSHGEVAFTEIDKATLRLDVSYPLSSSFECAFLKKVNVSVYTLVVEVSFGEEGNPIQQHEKFQITCSFSSKQTIESATKSIAEGLIAPKEIQSFTGTTSDSNVTLMLCDVLGNPINDGSVVIGRQVQLKVVLASDAPEEGLRPVHCDAVGEPNGKRYAVLRAGCGDGLVFSKTEGFIADGRSLFSPYFEVFDLPGEDYVKFNCNFTMCQIECLGSSCTNDIPRSRGRRDADQVTMNYIISAESQPVLLQKETPLEKDFSAEMRSATDVTRQNHKKNAWVAIITMATLSVVACILVVIACYRTQKPTSAFVAV